MNVVPGRDLQVRDVVRPINLKGPFSTAVVIAVKHEAVTLYRPYAITSEYGFACHDGGTRTIPYIGTETWDAPLSDMFELYERHEVK
jgi:hypothetical protein